MFNKKRKVSNRVQIGKKILRYDSSRHGQIGETMTWIVATMVIIVILALSILVASLVGNSREVSGQDFQNKDVLASKSFFSYLLTKDSGGETVYKQIQSEENLNDFNGNLGRDIFLDFYSKEYLDMWVGLFFDRTFNPSPSNDYFGDRPFEIRVGYIRRNIPHITQEVFLDENKSLELALKIEN